ncbi:MAG: DUF1573 domain-containing protein [Bacteroidales bacterium]|jgi:hypothetical protein|nr:DUF1573 domain-containing protein [Bacteroidales bacterium]
MKTIQIISLFLFIIILHLFPLGSKCYGSGSMADPPQISFEENEYDFGVIMPGDAAVHYFVFSNSGSGPLVISNVRSSCGCTVPAWPKTPIQAGARDSLKVEYNTKIKGAFNKTITVQSNAANPMVELRIKGSVSKTK